MSSILVKRKRVNERKGVFSSRDLYELRRFPEVRYFRWNSQRIITRVDDNSCMKIQSIQKGNAFEQLPTKLGLIMFVDYVVSGEVVFLFHKLWKTYLFVFLQ